MAVMSGKSSRALPVKTVKIGTQISWEVGTVASRGATAASAAGRHCSEHFLIIGVDFCQSEHSLRFQGVASIKLLDISSWERVGHGRSRNTFVCALVAWPESNTPAIAFLKAGTFCRPAGIVGVDLWRPFHSLACDLGMKHEIAVAFIFPPFEEHRKNVT